MSSNISVKPNYKHFWAKNIQKARLAPSVHNTQPWEFSVNEEKITIHRSAKRVLKMGDPTGRQTWISLGIIAEYLNLLAKQEGFSIDYELSENFITGILKPTKAARFIIPGLENAITNRKTDRSIYKKLAIPVTLQKDINSVVSDVKGAEVHLRNDKKFIDLLANLTSKGLGIAMSSPNFRIELAEWITNKKSGIGSGIPLHSLNLNAFQRKIQKPILKRGVFMKTESKREMTRWNSSSIIFAITTKGDLPDHWFTAGRAYARVVLLLTSKNISHATNAACVEASDFHVDIEKELNTKQRLQCLIRAGKGTDKVIPSVRLDIKELMRN